MRNKQVLASLFRWLAVGVFLLSVGISRLSAQSDLYLEQSFEQIQHNLRTAIQSRDTAQQALAWYQWALYDEQKAGNRDSVYAYLDKSARIYQSIGDTLHYYKVLAEQAERIANRGALPDEALRTRMDGLNYARAKNDRLLEAQMMAGIYRIWLLKGDTTEAQNWRNSLKEINKTVKDTSLIVMFMMEDVFARQSRGDYQDAAQLSFLALRMAEQTHQRPLIAEVEYNIGAQSHRAGRFFTAVEYLHKAEKSVLPGNYLLRRKIYRELSETYHDLDSLHVAIDYAIRYGQLGDTLLVRDRASARYRTAFHFDSEKKRLEINELEKGKKAAEELAEQRRKTNIATIALLVLVVVGATGMWYAYRQRLRANRIIAAQEKEISRQNYMALEKNAKIESMQAMLEGQESERQRIAHDLHDSLGGLLAAAKIQLENLPAQRPELAQSPEWKKLKDLLDDTVAEARHIARNLLPVALLRFGLVAAIQDLVSRVRGEGVPKITFLYFGDYSDIKNMAALHCFRIVQELLQNSLKHAGATEILVQLTRTDAEIALLVEDDGKGFDPALAVKGMGTHNLAQRVQFLQGELSVQTAPGEGASIHVTIPVETSQGFPG